MHKKHMRNRNTEIINTYIHIYTYIYIYQCISQAPLVNDYGACAGMVVL